jgi:hypothetical protein
LLDSKLPDQTERSVAYMPLSMVFKSSANCLTQANLQSMQQFESDIQQLAASYSICQLSSGACVAPASVLRLFDGTYEYLNVLNGIENVFRPDPSFTRITEILQTAHSLNGAAASTSENLRAFLDETLSSGP